jgi:SAM-dependent methyltransferase
VTGRRDSGPPLPIRVAGRAMTEAVARIPGAWRVTRGPMKRFFEGAAAGWDERVRPDSEEHLAPLVDAVDRLDAVPRKILDVGTGTGAAALWLAQRFEQADVLGVDVSPEMIERARAKAPGRVRFEVADTGAAAREGPFDLVVHLNCPVLFGDVAAALAEHGIVLVVASHGARTPFYTSHRALRRGFRRVDLEVVGEGAAGAGTWLAGQAGSRSASSPSRMRSSPNMNSAAKS